LFLTWKRATDLSFVNWFNKDHWLENTPLTHKDQFLNTAVVALCSA